MTSKSVPFLWIGGAFVTASAMAGAVLCLVGTGPSGIGAALRVTARWSFLLFWLAYAGSPAAVLFGPAFAPLARRGREFGLAFAAAHLIHVGLVAWLYQISSDPPLPWPLFVFFSIGIICIYLLAALSFGGAQAIGARRWRLLRFLGMNYILFAFARDFVPPVLSYQMLTSGLWHWVEYVPFAAMSITAPLLSFAAAARRRAILRPLAA